MATPEAYVITFTGFTGQLREHYKSVVAGLRAAEYSGSLQPGLTSHLVCRGEPEQLRASAKFRLAQASGIPTVSTDWLDDSQANGFLLSHEHYLLCLASPQTLRLPTVESVSGLCQPSVEKLRRQNDTTLGEFLAPRSLLAGLSPKDAVEPPRERASSVLCHDAIPELPDSSKAGMPSLGGGPSPTLGAYSAAPDSETFGGLDLLIAAADLGSTASQQARTGMQASVGQAAPAIGGQWLSTAAKRQRGPGPGAAFHSEGTEGGAQVAAPGPARSAAGHRGSGNCPAANHSKGMEIPDQLLPGSTGSGGTARSAAGAAAPPNAARPAVSPCGPSGKEADRALPGSGAAGSSENKTGSKARMLQLGTENVTVRRRRRPRRQRALPVSPSPRALGQDCLGPTGDLCNTGQNGTNAAAGAVGPESAEAASCTTAPVKPPQDGQQGAGKSGMTGPVGNWGLEQEPPESAVAASGPPSSGGLRGFVPTTKVVLGRRVANGPSRTTAESLMEHHGLASLRGVVFYSSAKLELPDGRELVFEAGLAGDATHGAKMVYDVRPDGTEQHAHALVLSIYTLPGSGEAYFGHRYFLTAADLEERPLWRSFLKDTVVRQDELLLTLGSYHSPLALCVEEFGVAFTGHVQLNSDPLPRLSRAYFPMLECRRGFDTARGRGVPLKKALHDLR